MTLTLNRIEQVVPCRKPQNLWANTAKVCFLFMFQSDSNPLVTCLSSSNSETQTASVKRYIFKNYA